MKPTSTLFLAFILLSGILNGQKTTYDSYSWSTIPEVTKKDTVKPVGGVKYTFERRIKEVYLNKEDYFEEINVFHRRIRVVTHDAIDNNNKIYIPVSNVIEILNIKARFISAAGKVTELAKENIKEVKNLENKGDYKIFAIEGVEIGGDIEYFYTLRCKFDAYQSIFMQGDEPRMNVEVLLTFPSKLEFLVKSYNGFPAFTTRKDDETGNTVIHARADYIPSLKSEKYANYNSNLMRYEYTMTYNSFNSSLRAYSWTKVGNNVYNNMYVLSKNEAAAVNDLKKKIELGNGSIEKKIRMIENWIKSEISISEAITETPALDEIIKYKQTSKYGATRLFVALMTKAEIPFELVLTCDRTKRKFDPEFNCWNFLDDYLIYFPEIDQYIVPDDPGIRLGVNAFNYQGAYGLFFRPVKYNEELGSLAYQVKKLPVLPCQNSTDSLSVKIVCNFKQLKSEIVINRKMSGAIGYSFQTFWESLDEVRHKEIISEVFDMGDKNTTIGSFTVMNGSRNDIGLKPIVFDINLTANTLVESAGKDFIFNIGKTIGAQEEMYQASKRVLPVEIDYIHSFYREIEFKIPAGYKVSNLKDINMKVEMVENGKTSAFFTSWYEQKGSTIYIHSHEVYPDLEYPLTRFNEFRKVVNAAADFNKKKLIITPL